MKPNMHDRLVLESPVVKPVTTSYALLGVHMDVQAKQSVLALQPLDADGTPSDNEMRAHGGAASFDAIWSDAFRTAIYSALSEALGVKGSVASVPFEATEEGIAAAEADAAKAEAANIEAAEEVVT